MTTATQFEIFVMPGEGIGPETITEATELLKRAIQAGRVSARVTELEVGEPAFARTGSYFPEDVRAKIDRACDSPRAAILFGACANEPIGDLRKRADLFANLRPIRAVPVLAGVSPLRDCVVADVDMVIVRELVSSIYYGQAREGATAGERWAGQEMYYRASEVRRIVRFAFELAAQRRGLLTWVHKRNVIKGVFALWADAIDEQRPQHHRRRTGGKPGDRHPGRVEMPEADGDVEKPEAGEPHEADRRRHRRSRACSGGNAVVHGVLSLFRTGGLPDQP